MSDVVVVLPQAPSQSCIAAAARLISLGALVLHSSAGESLVQSLARQYSILAARAEPVQTVKLSAKRQSASPAEPVDVDARAVTVYAVGDCRTAHAFVNDAVQATANSRGDADGNSSCPAVWRSSLRRRSSRGTCAAEASTPLETSIGSTPPRGVSEKDESSSEAAPSLLVHIKVVRDIMLFHLADRLATSSLRAPPIALPISSSFQPSREAEQEEEDGASTATSGLHDVSCNQSAARSVASPAADMDTIAEILQRHVLFELADGGSLRSSSPSAPSPVRVARSRNTLLELSGRGGSNTKSSPTLRHPKSLSQVRCVLVRCHQRGNEPLPPAAPVQQDVPNAVHDLVQDIQAELRCLSQLLLDDSCCDAGDVGGEVAGASSWRDGVRQHLLDLEQFVMEAENAVRKREGEAA